MLDSTMDALVARGWVEEEGPKTGKLRLTAQGRTLHATALVVQKKIRRQAVRGIDAADYATTVRVLQQMVANLTAGDD